MTAADRPSVMPRVGDTLTTAEQLDALPSLAIVIDANDEVQQRHGHLSTERGDYSAWLGVMPPTCKPSPDVALPVTVLYVPGEQPADRPSVTDNARDKEPLAWCPGCGDRIPTEVVRERGVCSNCCGTSDDPWVADRAETTTEQPCRHCGSCDGPPTCPDCDHADRRAETTTATVEDTARAIHRALAPRWMSVAQALGPDQDAYEAMLADIAQALADAGLLATTRTLPTREQVTAAIGDAANSMQVGFGVVSITAAVDAVLALYADQPTREDLARAIATVVHHVGYEPDHPTPNRHDYRAADAVLALLRGDDE